MLDHSQVSYLIELVRQKINSNSQDKSKYEVVGDSINLLRVTNNLKYLEDLMFELDVLNKLSLQK